MNTVVLRIKGNHGTIPVYRFRHDGRELLVYGSSGHQRVDGVDLAGGYVYTLTAMGKRRHYLPPAELAYADSKLNG